MALETIPCPLGCQGPDEFVVTGHDRQHGLPGEFTVVRCQACGLARTSPRPTPESMGDYYPDDYGPYVGTRIAVDAAAQTGLKARALATAKTVFDTKAHSLPDIPVGRMLEFGCASGNFLKLMADRGWDVEGVEFSPDAAEAARSLGFPVDIGALEGIEKAENSYDLVVGWMVVEHLHDPVGGLRKLARWTKPGGQLAVSVPDSGAAEARLFGKRWYALQLPNHLFHFDASSITKVMAASGWRVTRIQRHRTMSNLIASAGYWLEDKGWLRVGKALKDFPERGGRIGALALFPVSYVMASLNQTGRMTVWAERTGE